MTQAACVERITEEVSIDKPAVTPSHGPCSSKVEEVEDYTGRYREMLGSLVWLSNSIRPDITQSLRVASRHDGNPTPEDWRNVLPIFEYHNSAVDLGITYERGSREELMV